MKTKMFKFVLPVFAILLAVSFAFATEATTVDQVAYYDDPILGWQPTNVEDACGKAGFIPCKFNGNQLYTQPSYKSMALRKD